MGKIRQLAVALIKHKDKYLVVEGHDRLKAYKFYRAPGGGIEFGETGEQALRREMVEGFAVKIEKVKYLGLVENIFDFEGSAGHEICLIYQAEIKDPQFLAKQKVKVLDSESDFGVWVAKSKFLKQPFYPEGIEKFLK